MGVCITCCIVSKNPRAVIFPRLGSLLEPIPEPQADPPTTSIVLPLILIAVFAVILLLDGVCGFFVSYWTSPPQITYDGNAVRKVLGQTRVNCVGFGALWFVL